jgi:hypothetical protein|tara:strand:+ start:691 stop:2376 length:1686 start_codon:yes stop_codon:yes gene_type:complete
MKKIYLILIALIGIMISCSEEFTDVDPIGSLSDTQLANPTGIDLLLTGAYSVLDAGRNGGIGNGWGRSADNWVADVASDDAHKGSTDGDQPDLYELELFNWQTGNGYFMARWEVLYAGVNRANAVINLIANSEDPSAFVVENAQARFLRGHYNFELKKLFGSVPNITEENAKNLDYNVANAGETLLTWADIEADFSHAMGNLPSVRTAAYSQAGRPLSSTAQAFLGKAQLFQSKWGEASANLEAVISTGIYGLHPSIVDNFRSETENGQEAMFAIQYSADDGQGFQGNATGALNYPAAFGWCCGFYQPTQDLVDAYQTENGLPMVDTFQASSALNHDYNIDSDAAFTVPSANVDPRLDFTVGRRGVDYNGYGLHAGKSWIRANFSDISGPYLPKKNIFQASDANNFMQGGWGQNLSGINYHIMRYADVLLMAAEAAVESGNLERGRTLVNQVRNRAKTMSWIADTNADIELYNAAWSSATDARKAVRFERRLELAMEGHRYFDLVRWGNMSSHMAAYIANESETITTFGKGQSFQDKHTYYPIPLSAIDLSGGKLVQNPGH